MLLAKKIFRELEYNFLFEDCTDEFKGDIFHIAACISGPEVLKFLMESPLVHKAIDWKLKNTLGQNVLMRSLFNRNESVFEILLRFAEDRLNKNDLKQLLFETDNNRKTVLFWICYLGSLKHFQIFDEWMQKKFSLCDLDEFFLEVDSNGNTFVTAKLLQFINMRKERSSGHFGL